MAKAKTRDVLLLLIAMLLACAAALPAKAAAPTFSVMLPTSLPITIDAAGNVAVADDAAIVNNGDGAVKVDSIAVEPCGAWTLEPWGTTFGIVGEHRFSLRIGGVAAQADGSVDVSGLGSIESGGSLTLSYDAAVPPQADALAQTIANVVFTVSWRDGEPVEEEGDVYAILYTDGELVFQRGDTPEDGRAVTAVYGDIETTTDVPWENQTSKIKSVTFLTRVAPVTTNSWFEECSKITTLDLTALDTSKVTNMEYMFDTCTGLESVDVSGWDTSRVTTMRLMFSDCYSLKALDLSSWDTSSLERVNYMFDGCHALKTCDLSGWDTSNVTNMTLMFGDCRSLTTIWASDTFVTTGVTVGDYPFSSCALLVGGNGTAYADTRGGIEYARIDRIGAPGYFTEKAAA